jgi:cytochrome P450
MISERRSELNGESTAQGTERKDIFSLLVRASEEDSKFKLSDSELVSDNIEQWGLFLARCEVGNVFAMMFAGHGLCIFCLIELNGQLIARAETTAFTLASTIGFLGLHSEVQEDLYEQIMEVVGCDRDPVGHNFSRIISCRDMEVSQTFEDFPRLEKVAHAFYEALRLFRWFFFAS